MKFVRNALQLMSQSARKQKIKTCPTSMVKVNLNEFKYAPISILSSTNPFNGQKDILGSFNQQRLQWYEIAKKHSTEAGDGGNSDISKRISGLVTASDVVVFMKGVPSAPRCGFSNAVCQIFRMHNVEIDAHDVLADEELRQGIKDYSDWPTIPQVYFKGEFIGGCDILLQMHQNGELIEELSKIGLQSALLTAEENKEKTDDK